MPRPIARPFIASVPRSLEDSNDVLLGMGKGRPWRFRIAQGSPLQRAKRWLAAVVRVLLRIVGIVPARDVRAYAVDPFTGEPFRAIPKPRRGIVYKGL